MASYGFEYFCGANVMVEIEDFPILEAVGLSVSVSESMMPVYGYSSKLFDAVARGQVIVQGSLLVNYVHQDYLWEAVNFALEDKGLLRSLSGPPSASDELYDALGNPVNQQTFMNTVFDDYGNSSQIVTAMKNRFWTPLAQITNPVSKPNPHDSFGGLDIKVTFGDRQESNQWLGSTGYLLSNVFFTGRGQRVEIDENVIVEEYPFFARNIYGLKPEYRISDTPAGEIDANTDIVTTVERLNTA